MSAVNEQEIRTRSIGYKKRKPQQIGQKFLFLFSKRNAFCFLRNLRGKEVNTKRKKARGSAGWGLRPQPAETLTFSEAT